MSAGARLIHLSTDFVFDGRRERGGYREDDAAVPITDYGRAKLAGERAVATASPDALIVRTSLIYGGDRPGPHELMVLDALDGLRDVAFFSDELRCPILAAELAGALLELARRRVAGTLHVAGADTVSARVRAAGRTLQRPRPGPAAVGAERGRPAAASAQLRARLLARGGTADRPGARRAGGAGSRCATRRTVYTRPMATAESAFTRARSGAVSARTFQRAALITLGLLWLVVVTGGLVRLTASGLGCPHWPTCQADSLIPSTGYHAVVEFSNRVISGIAMVAAVVTAWLGFRTPGLARPVIWGAVAAAAGTVAQVPLGAVTVAFDCTRCW